MFCEESLRKINAKDLELFRNGSVHQILSPESLDYFGTTECFSGRKKEESL